MQKFYCLLKTIVKKYREPLNTGIILEPGIQTILRIEKLAVLTTGNLYELEF